MPCFVAHVCKPALAPPRGGPTVDARPARDNECYDDLAARGQEGMSPVSPQSCRTSICSEEPCSNPGSAGATPGHCGDELTVWAARSPQSPPAPLRGDTTEANHLFTHSGHEPRFFLGHFPREAVGFSVTSRGNSPLCRGLYLGVENQCRMQRLGNQGQATTY